MSVALSTHTTLLRRLTTQTDQSAWREFHERYGDLIRGFAERQNLQPADCDDILQDVLIGLTRCLPDFQYDPARGTFRAYLKTIVLRAIYHRFRQKPVVHTQASMEEMPDPAAADPALEQAWEEEWRDYHLRLAMRTIAVEFDQQHRAAFQAYALDGRDARETANMLGMSVDGVYQCKSRILKRIGELIEQQIEEEG